MIIADFFVAEYSARGSPLLYLKPKKKTENMEKLIEPPKNWTQLDVPTYLR